MRWSVVVLSLVTACVSTTPASPVTTTPPPPTPATFEAPATTSTTQPVEYQGCRTPPVTFAPLCEMYELLEEWYVDAPVDHSTLAEVAVRGLNDFTTTETEDPPRTLFCAIPNQAFVVLCDALAERVASEAIPVGPAVEAAVSYMIDVGLDPFTYYVTPDQVGAFRFNGVVGGIGVLLDARDLAGSKCAQLGGACALEIVTVLEGNPGFDAGLEPGDVVTAVDGEPVDGKGFAAVVASIAGDETGTVSIDVTRGGELLTFDIERAELTVPTVEVGLPFAGVGYLKIPDFEFDIPQLVREGLRDLNDSGPGTIVVDLRDNPGGFIDAVVAVADEFISGGTVMVSEAPDERFEYPAMEGGLATGPRLIVLVNKGTASAAEILTGALRDRRNAIVVGSDTFGKDAVQIPFSLRNGGEFYVVVARWSTPNGTTAAVDGLSPDYEVTWPDGATVEEIVEIALEATP